MLKEEFLHELMQEIYKNESLEIYDNGCQLLGDDEASFANIRLWAHQLVRDKLASYIDEERTMMHLTHYGKYWILQGGYTTFLKEEHVLKEKELKDQHKEALLEARLKLTNYRLIGFWLTLIISIAGFMLSVFNLYLFFSKK